MIWFYAGGPPPDIDIVKEEGDALKESINQVARLYPNDEANHSNNPPPDDSVRPIANQDNKDTDLSHSPVTVPHINGEEVGRELQVLTRGAEVADGNVNPNTNLGHYDQQQVIDNVVTYNNSIADDANMAPVWSSADTNGPAEEYRPPQIQDVDRDNGVMWENKEEARANPDDQRMNNTMAATYKDGPDDTKNTLGRETIDDGRQVKENIENQQNENHQMEDNNRGEEMDENVNEDMKSNIEKIKNKNIKENADQNLEYSTEQNTEEDLEHSMESNINENMEEMDEGNKEDNIDDNNEKIERNVEQDTGSLIEDNGEVDSQENVDQNMGENNEENVEEGMEAMLEQDSDENTEENSEQALESYMEDNDEEDEGISDEDEY